MNKIAEKEYKFKMGDIVLFRNNLPLRVVMRYRVMVMGETHNSYLVGRRNRITTHARETELKIKKQDDKKKL